MNKYTYINVTVEEINSVLCRGYFGKPRKNVKAVERMVAFNRYRKHKVNKWSLENVEGSSSGVYRK